MKNKLDECILCKGEIIWQYHKPDPNIIVYECKVCTKVRFDHDTLWENRATLKEKGYLLAGYVRELFSKGKQTPLLKSQDLDSILNSKDIPQNPAQRIDKLIFFIGKNTDGPGELITIAPEYDYPICYCKNPEEFTRILNDALTEELIDTSGEGKYWLRTKGFEKYSEIVGS
jgi:hypothetical protein